MTHTLSRFFLVSLVMAMASACGCSKQDGKVQVLTVEKIKSTVDNSFSGDSTEARTAANDALEALKNKDLNGAFLKFKSLSERPDLTREQRIAASSAFASTLQQTADAAARGDEQAKQVMKTYMMSK